MGGDFTIAVRAQDEGDSTEFTVDVDLHHDFDDKQVGRIRDVMERCGICDIIKRSHSVKVNLINCPEKALNGLAEGK
jgi:uncharacterized OsmC-like protein